MDGDSLGDVKGVFEDKLHVLGRAQAGVQEVLGGDGLAQHVGNALGLAALFTGLDLVMLPGQLGLLGLILTPGTKTSKHEDDVPPSNKTHHFYKMCQIIIHIL